MATFTYLLSSPYSALFSHPKRHRLHHHPLPVSPFSPAQLKSDWGCGRQVLGRVKCSNEPSNDDVESETGLRSLGSDTGSGISSYSWCAGLGGLGFLETSYLSYLKFTGSDAFCPVGGGSCGDVLNSSYAAVFGIPLPLIGMVAYGAAAFLAPKLAAKDLLFGIDESNGGLILLEKTTSMATASTYFLYILNTQFPEASCSYCLVSVLLSFSLFFTTAKSLGWQKIREEVGLQLCIAGLVFAALSNSYSASALPPPTRFGEKFLPYSPTEIKAPSGPLALKLAAHLRSVGAKMYGAFWCSHCLEQKEMFGQVAAKMLDYGECYPDGFKIGTPLSQECKEVKIRGLPMWVIKGQVLEGYKSSLLLQKRQDLKRVSSAESLLNYLLRSTCNHDEFPISCMSSPISFETFGFTYMHTYMDFP